jgi:hypothetical protein
MRRAAAPTQAAALAGPIDARRAKPARPSNRALIIAIDLLYDPS